MKNSFNFSLSISMLFLMLCLFSCKEDKVTPGPAGTPRAKGEPGNANVVMYTYGSRTFSSGSQIYLIPNMTVDRMDSSIVLAYYNPSTESSTAWYAVPGIGPSGHYEARSLVYQGSANEYIYSLRLLNVGTNTNYSNSVTFTKFRIIIAKASSIIPDARTQAIDFNDYNAVKAFYNLSE